jgi:hypothetical protein
MKEKRCRKIGGWERWRYCTKDLEGGGGGAQKQRHEIFEQTFSWSSVYSSIKVREERPSAFFKIITYNLVTYPGSNRHAYK